MLDINSQYEVAIAALLHDIGKFKQRAYKGDESVFSSAISNMEGYIGKLNSITKLYTHRHALWTYDFFLNDFKPIIDKIDFDLQLKWEEVFISSASHHNPDDDNYSTIIQKADFISSSNDRSDCKEAYKRGDYYKKPLRSIFTNINIEEKIKPKKSEYYYPLSSSTRNFYPTNDDAIELDYKSLWTEFVQALKALPSKMTIVGFLMKLKDLLYQYTWCIPSSTTDNLNDISLYDHSLTTMAFALAIANSSEEGRFRIFAADLSGIQQYIFQSKYSSFKGAAKIFRGRSFIISSISYAYRIALCEKLGIIPFVDLIDAGGKFTMILPPDEELVAKIDEFVKEQEFFFFKNYQGTLCVLTDYSLVANKDAFSKEMFVETQKEIGYLLNSKKTKKFENIIREIGYVIHNIDIDGNRCSVCGKNKILNQEKQICRTCETVQQIGGNVLTNEFINFNKHKGYEIVKNVYISVKDEILETNYFTFSFFNSNIYPLWRLNTHSPNETFDYIAKTSLSDEGLGKSFLAYVKIDVDNLGEIFISGFPKEIYSISRYITLSRLLNQFFNVMVKNILEKDYIDAYTVISGGDDVFIILPWNQALDFIKDLKLRFSWFCCKNNQINFSAGIVVGYPKEPFALLNEKANYQLDKNAKEKEGKNCISYFGVLFNAKELRTLIEDSNTIRSFVMENSLSSSFIYRVYGYVNDLLPEGNTKQLSDSNRKKWSVHSKIRYDLVRNIKVENDDKKAEIFKFFLDHLDNYENYLEIERFKVALIHTMYGLRKN